MKQCNYDASYKRKCEDFRREAQTILFDICYCKCPDIKECKCENERRVPVRVPVIF